MEPFGNAVPLTLLVVDDDDIDRLAVRRYLRQAGILLTIDEVTSADEALERIRSKRYDCLLLDYYLPGVDGPALLKVIRSTSPGLPVLIMTGRGDEDIAVELMKSGAVDYVPKASLSSERLATGLRHATELSRAAVRTACFQAVTAALTGALTPEDVAEVIMQQVLPAVGAVAGVMLILNEKTQMLEGLYAVGHADASRAAYMHMAVSDNMPIAVALREGKPVYYESREAVLADFPHLRSHLEADDHGAFAVLPLRLEGRAVGGLRLSFRGPWTFDPSDQAFLMAIAQQGAKALERGRLYAAEHAARAEAEAAIQARDELMGLISHDLRNPLTVIRGHIQLLRRRAARPAGLSTDELLSGLETIESSITGLATQIDELQDATHLQAGRPLELNLRSMDLIEVTRLAVLRHQGMADKHRLHFETTLPSLVGTWDAGRLERVLGNLLSNAIKYSPLGGEIAVSLSSDGDGVELAVEDHGLGIPAQDLPYIFERFHRAGNVVGRISGSGLGLAGARDIVQQHGGTIRVESAEGQGSRFVVRLPLTTGTTPCSHGGP
jgi:signal transduction histidine kinase/FixJ family two-component response regulator